MVSICSLPVVVVFLRSLRPRGSNTVPRFDRYEMATRSRYPEGIQKKNGPLTRLSAANELRRTTSGSSASGAARSGDAPRLARRCDGREGPSRCRRSLGGRHARGGEHAWNWEAEEWLGRRENRGDEVCIVNGSFVVDVIGDDESPRCSTAFDLPKDLAGSPGEAPARQVRSRRRLPSVEMFGPRRPVLQRGFLVFFFF